MSGIATLWLPACTAKFLFIVVNVNSKEMSALAPPSLLTLMA